MIPAIQIGKLVVQTLVTLGTTEIVKNAIQATTPIGISLYKKVVIAIGQAAVTGFVSYEAGQYMGRVIDSTIPRFIPETPADPSPEAEVKAN